MKLTEFKIKYPQYSHLEGDALWDKMTLTLLESNNTLYADPNQVKTYNKSVTLDLPQDNGTYAISHISLEDESTTRWLNSKGELVRVGNNPILDAPTSVIEPTTYSFVIWDANKKL